MLCSTCSTSVRIALQQIFGKNVLQFTATLWRRDTPVCELGDWMSLPLNWQTFTCNIISISLAIEMPFRSFDVSRMFSLGHSSRRKLEVFFLCCRQARLHRERVRDGHVASFRPRHSTAARCDRRVALYVLPETWMKKCNFLPSVCVLEEQCCVGLNSGDYWQINLSLHLSKRWTMTMW